jgi:hypothetical protein
VGGPAGVNPGIFATMGSRAEISIGPLVLPAYAGSFDFVRLAPHCAQDDRVISSE